MNYEAMILDLIRKSRLVAMNMPKVEDTTFTNETVHLDFVYHDRCKFMGCTLIVEFGIFKLTNSEFHGCKFIAVEGSPAFGVLSLNNMLQEAGKLEKMR